MIFLFNWVIFQVRSLVAVNFRGYISPRIVLGNDGYDETIFFGSMFLDGLKHHVSVFPTQGKGSW